MAVFFTSDTHFHHAGKRELYPRRFESVAATGVAMLARWNANVGPKVDVGHLGYFAFDVLETATADHLEPRVDRQLF
jgi:calcineurin-like phosphoesterase family protein